VDRMQSTLGRKSARARWRLLLCGDGVGFEAVHE
jgi:hypothetical protein